MASERRESRVTATTYGASLWVLPRSTDSDRRTGGGADGCTLVQISQFRRASSAASASARSLAGMRERNACGLRSSRGQTFRDRKSTRLNSSHTVISYAVFCLKKKKKRQKKYN